ncbi:hypothetical protein J5N97_001936 [Dioscorea zingiberensis]|uniref:Uncharacterized protein n=1 Tax=Dioscorea zingiberensis TaxID=325984 RepID=A0A9D5BSS8_9LILI|nr:hypothetical protein J5N97_001936 [Dioscorea zingiberensis]
MGSLAEPEEANGKALGDAWDFKGRPSVRTESGGWTSAAMILGVELCERLTTLGIAVNLVTYLTGTMHLGNAASANTVTNFLGTSFMLCLLGGFIADTFLGRYLTIAIFAAVQASGVTILTISTVAPGLRPAKCGDPAGGVCERASGKQLGVLYVGLYLTALGTGGLKSSVSGFWSDQFDESDPMEKKGMSKFFSWFFFFISLGSLMAVTVLVYIQDNLGRCGVMGYAPRRSHTGGACRLLGWDQEPKQKLPHTNQFRFLDRAAIINDGAGEEKNKWRLSTVTDVEEVKMVVGMLPVWATTIMFWTVYAQMTTFSVSQATTMDRHIGNSFEIPAGSLTVFFVGSILLTVPVYDRVVAPVARRLSGNPQGLSPLQRIGVGLVLSILAMAAAAFTERKRLSSVWSNEATIEKGSAVALSVFWLVPQFFLVGAGEAFTYIGQLDFFLRECPKGMKTMSTGLFLSTLSLGFFVSTALVTIVHKVTGKSGHGAWLPDDLNLGRLYDFYWLLAMLSVLNLGFFLLCAKWYVYKDDRMAAAGLELDDPEPCYHA